MPTYTYKCGQCSHKFEAVQRMIEDPLTDCPACRAVALVKEIQPVGFALKGSGWYVTDFRDKGKATKSDSEGAKTESSDTSSDTKSDIKTETKVEAKAEGETKTEAKTETKTTTTSTTE